MGLELPHFQGDIYLTFVHQLKSTPHHNRLLAVGIMEVCLGLVDA